MIRAFWVLFVAGIVAALLLTQAVLWAWPDNNPCPAPVLLGDVLWLAGCAP